MWLWRNNRLKNLFAISKHVTSSKVKAAAKGCLARQCSCEWTRHYRLEQCSSKSLFSLSHLGHLFEIVWKHDWGILIKLICFSFVHFKRILSMTDKWPKKMQFSNGVRVPCTPWRIHEGAPRGEPLVPSVFTIKLFRKSAIMKGTFLILCSRL